MRTTENSELLGGPKTNLKSKNKAWVLYAVMQTWIILFALSLYAVGCSALDELLHFSFLLFRCLLLYFVLLLLPILKNRTNFLAHQISIFFAVHFMLFFALSVTFQFAFTCCCSFRFCFLSWFTCAVICYACIFCCRNCS